MEGWGTSSLFEKSFPLTEGRRASGEGQSLLKLPSAEGWFPGESWEDSELGILRGNLNRLKSELDSKPLDSWNVHTKRREPTGRVSEFVREAGNPELLTQSWCKFTECLNTFDLLGACPEKETLRTVHLCEVPGAFVSALNHFLACDAQRSLRPWAWRATSLHPHCESVPASLMISDDRLLLHTAGHWAFGRDGTGDLLRKCNLEALPAQLGGGETGAHLVTADGSFDCLSDPCRQESTVLPLLLAEVYVALSVLLEGGHLVLKLFTAFEAGTVCLLRVLGAAFQSVTLFKPATSRQGNSEVYAVCLGFAKGCLDPGHLGRLGEAPFSGKPLFSREDVSEEFLRSVRRASCSLGRLQSGVIRDNLLSYRLGDPGGRPKGERQRLDRLRLSVAEEFVRRHRIGPLPRGRCLLPRGGGAPELPLNYYNHRRERRSAAILASTSAVSRLTPRQQLELELLEATRLSRHGLSLVPVFRWTSLPARVAVRPQYGESCRTVLASKYCSPRALLVYRRVLDAAGQPGAAQPPRPTRFPWEPVRAILDCLPEVRGQLSVVWTGPAQPCTSGLSGPDLKVLLGAISSRLSGLSRGQNLLLVELPLLARASVGLVLLLGAHFERVGFFLARESDSRHGILFSGLKCSGQAAELWLTSLAAQLEGLSLSLPGLEPVELVPVADTVAEPFYSHLCAHNLGLLRREGLRCLRALS
jgi:hypothetical protein